MHASREKVIFARLHAAWTREITRDTTRGKGRTFAPECVIRESERERRSRSRRCVNFLGYSSARLIAASAQMERGEFGAGEFRGFRPSIKPRASRFSEHFAPRISYFYLRNFRRPESLPRDAPISRAIGQLAR